MYAELNYKKTLILSLCFIKCVVLGAASQNQSIAAMTAKYTFLSSYW